MRDGERTTGRTFRTENKGCLPRFHSSTPSHSSGSAAPTGASRTSRESILTKTGLLDEKETTSCEKRKG